MKQNKYASTGAVQQFQAGNYCAFGKNQLWGAAGSLPNTFTYQYDMLDRLLNGTSTGISMSEALTYDDMGNIAALNRNSAGASTYSYTGNQLNSISGSSISMTGSYAYDGNSLSRFIGSNAVTDGRNGVSLAYNVLNLPATATKSGLSLAYTYSASGEKLRKVSNGTTTEYIDGIQYTGSTIDFIQTEEGIPKTLLLFNGPYFWE